MGKEYHILFYREISDGPSVPLVFEEWEYPEEEE